MKGMSSIVQTVTRAVTAPILLFGIYLMLGATHSHGAGLAGGVIIASLCLLLLLAYGRDALKQAVRPSMVITAAAAALLALVVTVSLTMLSEGMPASAVWIDRLTPYLPLLNNVFLCLITAAALIAVILSFTSFEKQEE